MTLGNLISFSRVTVIKAPKSITLTEERLAKIMTSKKGQRIVFDRYYPAMHLVAFRYLKVVEDVEDALSEAFVRVFRYANKFEFKGEGSLKKWIKTIVINESLRLLDKRQKLLFSDEMVEHDTIMTDDLEGNIDMEYFLRVVDDLPNGYRIVFLMFVVEEYTHKEIADKLNISVSTSKSQLFKARSLLMKKLTKMDEDETYRLRKSV